MATDFRPRTIGVLIDDTISLYRANWRTILKISGIVMLPAAVTYSIISIFYLRAVAEWFVSFVGSAALSSGGPPQLDPAITIIAAISSVAALAYQVAGVFLAATLYANAGVLLEGAKPPLRSMLKAGAVAFLPLLIVDFAVRWAAGIAGALSLYVGGLVVAVLFAVAGPVVVIEGVIGAAFKRSLSLVRGNFWRVALFAAGAYFISTQFESALASPVVLREVIFGAQQQSVLTAQLAWGWKVFDGVLQGVAIAIVVPFLDLAFLQCYLDLRSREEGMDLVVRARALTDAAR
ncbi:MAG: hypothetical protein Q7W30_07215 [Coriobacteriia bacterium]|nr:hypothetical protein [Coriobacteriia bacterium]